MDMGRAVTGAIFVLDGISAWPVGSYELSFPRPFSQRCIRLQGNHSGIISGGDAVN